MPLRGRGASYSTARGIVEWTLHRAYWRHWPARMVGAFGLVPRVRIRHHRVVTPRWPAGARPLRIAFASDLHAGPTTHAALLDDAFAGLAHARADIVSRGVGSTEVAMRFNADPDILVVELCGR